jgi:hypothetical protein
MEVYHGTGTQKVEDEEEILEFDLEEEQDEIAQKFLAIVVYHSHKSFSAQYLFSDMLHAWGIAELPQIERLEAYSSKVEFNNYALIVVHYDGMVRPSEVNIESIGLWIRLYGLPQ